MFAWIGNAIYDAILKLIWLVFVQGPLNLVAAFNKVLEYLTGGIINDLLFGSSKTFQWSKVPAQFWWFVAVSLCLFSLIFTIQMIILLFQEAAESKAKFVLAIQNAVKAFIFIFLIPIFFFIANFIVQNLADTVINNFGNGNNIADYLWHIGDPTWDGTANGVPNDYSSPNNLKDYNLIAQVFGTWFMLFAIFIIGIILIQKIIELFFLFVISPIVMIVMVIDNGRAAFTWKDMVIAKFLASTATLIGYYIFISVTQILLSSNLSSLPAQGFAKSLFVILFLCGGGLATIGFSNMVASFIGESTGLREGMDSFRSTVTGGMMAMGASKLAAKMTLSPIHIARKSGKIGLNGLKYANDYAANKRSRNNSQFDNLNNDDAYPNKSKLNTNSFRSTANGMALRSGIDGLKGLKVNLPASEDNKKNKKIGDNLKFKKSLANKNSIKNSKLSKLNANKTNLKNKRRKKW